MSSFDDLASPAEMHADCEAVGRNLGLARRLQRAAESAVGPAPSMHFDDFPQETTKRDIEISEAASRLANALHLHLD